ncbi:MAG TPA: exodeoxyribonuclease V subunit alpha [Tessaracoccus flavescens]|uniref:RecBCD enzyme subunit RecD n=1 Tax=Tessaracoccus flavescens TaxID=399497 RepID=A0A921EQ04_9ACTN|nr:exodeoxyribonuclease V subunit alpha [Tessaracoccus flavescens]
MSEIPIAATGTLRAFCDARMLQLIDFHVARRLAQLAGEADADVQLAFALAARELRLGSVCVDLATAPQLLKPEVDSDDGSAADDVTLPWPTDTAAWIATVEQSPAVATPGEPPRAFRLSGTLLYLERYWQEESTLAALLAERSALGEGTTHASRAWTVDERQEEAIEAATTLLTTVITGGPGTGKTTIVSTILDRLAPSNPSVALCAPTGKAAARLSTQVISLMQADVALWSGTIHKLLGIRPRSAEAEFSRSNPLPYDVVVVDETSMASLEIMRQLLEAVAPTTRLILLGDPQQLRSVEAGAVLADIERAHLVHAPGGAIVRLVTNHRSNQDITRVAAAIESGDVDAVRSAIEAAATVNLVEFDGDADPMSFPALREVLLQTASTVQAEALLGNGLEANTALNAHRILCGHREGPFGVGHWGRNARLWLAQQLPDYGYDHAPYVGQPLLILKNSDLLRNGETGVVVRNEMGDLTAVIDGGDGLQRLNPSLLDDAEDLHAMTIHKSQGSQFSHVSIVLPPLGSPLLTRELIYTAITRAQHGVTLYGSLEALDAAVVTPARRASGLGRA